MEKIPFFDLGVKDKPDLEKIFKAMERAISAGQFILGPEVELLEKNLAAYSEVKYAITCANGTDALVLALKALDVKPGEVVFVPSFTYVATAGSVASIGAAPYFVDVDEGSFNISAASLKAAIIDAKKQGLKYKAVIAVDLFGQPADYDEIRQIAKENGLKLIADSAQSFGGKYKDKKVGSLADITTASFYPTKPLGCFGDGGAILTDSADYDGILRSYRFHGRSENDITNHSRIGYNSRLDTIQAAILLEKLPGLDSEIKKRNEIAARYKKYLADSAVKPPEIKPFNHSAWAQYTVTCGKRDDLKKYLDGKNIPSAIYYALPVHMQDAYKNYPKGNMPVTEKLAKEVISLPVYPSLQEEQQMHIIDNILEFKS